MVVSVAHLDDEERALVLGVLLEEVLSRTRSLLASQRLRALVVFDEASAKAIGASLPRFRGSSQKPRS